MMKIFKNIVAFFTIIILVNSCGLNKNTTISNTQNLNNVLTIGDISAIPVSNISDNYSLLAINNISKKDLRLNSISIENNGTNISNSNLYRHVDATNCSNLKSNSQCDLKIYNINSNGGYLIWLKFADHNNNLYNLKQLISYTKNLPVINGIQIGSLNYTLRSSSLTIPFLLNQNFESVSITIGDKALPLTCSHKYTKDSLCTMIVEPTQVSNHSLIRIFGYSNNREFNNYIRINYQVPTLSAHLIISVMNPVINPADGSSPIMVTLYNNGNSTASNISIYGVTPISVQNAPILPCGTSIAVNSSCNFYINESIASLSGQSTVIVKYSDTNNTNIQLVPINVSYITKTNSPSLSLTSSGDFNNSVINQNTTMYVNVTNNGNADLSNLRFSDISRANPALSSFARGSSCSNGMSLSVGQNCLMVLSYSPSATQNGKVSFSVAGNYTNSGGAKLTYSNASLDIPYSANSGSIFTAVGDLGVVINSPAGGGGTWSAKINSPFPNISVSGNKIYINNESYVLPMSNGKVMYSGLNGLFWKDSGSTNLSSSRCSVIYDGNNYYTCGTNSLASGACPNIGFGCVIRSNNLTGNWAALYQTQRAVTINDIAYFNSGGNAAYIALVADTAGNGGLATSTNGYQWQNARSGQGGGDTNFDAVAFNPGSNIITAWNSLGYNSSVNITTSLFQWTANTSRSPANRVVTSAIYQGNNYILSLANGNIYTATNVTGSESYNLVSDNKIQLNSLAYASMINSGTFMAVGNNGVNLSTKNPNVFGAWNINPALVVGQNITPNLLGLYYDGNHLWATGTNAILKTKDGVNWATPTLKSIANSAMGYLAVDNQGNIYSSTDLTNWVKRLNPTSKVLNSVSCLSNNLCFAVGDLGTILKTTDGITWSQIISNTSNSLNSINCNYGICIIGGSNGNANSGTILISDQNNNFAVKSSNLPTNIINAVFTTTNGYLAIGANGTIFTSNNGNNWSLVNSGTSVNLYGVSCSRFGQCVVVGQSGKILFSNNNGTSWSNAVSNTTKDLLSVAYNGNFVAVGKGGVLLCSNTGYGTWNAAKFPTTSTTNTNLNAVISN
ncbi:MAG: hypothetical protein ACK5WP_03555 [Neisseriaceae bacterium]